MMLKAVAKALVTEGPRSVLGAVAWAIRQRMRSLASHERPASAPEAAPQSFPMLCWQLEEPELTHAPEDPATFRVRGWIAAPERVSELGFREPEAKALLPLAIEDRPLVSQQYGGIPATGFASECAYDKVRGRGPFTLAFRAQGRDIEIVVPTHRPPRDRAQLKREKLARIASIARCPVCHSEAMNTEAGYLQCRRCRTVFPRDETRIDFLTPELRARFNIVPTANVSAGVYDGESFNLIHRLADGLILDCGAGLRDRYFANVVNFEIVPYDTTDVVGVGEALPFRDASFDAVFSFAVLEHVKDPFACAREIVRVLKPGGKLYCQVPFLQPVHGYPNHYYNMTAMGMLNLFGDALRVEALGPFFFGQPVHALSWILNRYVEGLPAEQREAFRDLRVSDLMQPADKYHAAPFVQALAPASREELSCCNALIATKLR